MMAVQLYTGRIRTGVLRAIGAGVGPVGRSVRNFLRLALGTTAGRIGLPTVAFYLMLALIGPWLAPHSSTGFNYDEAGKVQSANLDGSDVVDLAANLLADPKYMALDVAGGKMYWTDEAGLEQLLDPSGQFLLGTDCLLYTSPSPRDRQKSRMPSSA